MRWLALVPWLDKKILLALTLTVAAAGTGYAVFTSGASAPAPPGVTSRVLDMVTGDPLGGVSVQVTDEDGVDLPVPAVITAADGTFSIDGFSHTTIGLRVDGAALDFGHGFVDCYRVTHGRSVRGDVPCPFSTDFTEDIALWRTFVEARVVDSTTGEPVDGVVVQITSEHGVDYPGFTATTSADGIFRVSELITPTLHIDEFAFRIDGSAVGYATGFVETSLPCGVRFGAPVLVAWSLVRCTTSASTGWGRDIALDPVFSTPQVVDSETGDPVAGVLIALTNEHGTDIPGATTTTAADGTYILPSVPHEEISIRVDGSAVGYESGFTPGWPLEPFGWAVHRTHGEVVNTSPSFAADISLDRLPDPVDYRARVVDGWTHIPVENVTVQLVDSSGVSISGYSATTAADGTFTIPGVRSSEVVILVDGAAIEYQRGYVGCRSPYHPEELHLVEVVSGLGDSCAWEPTYSDDIALFQTVVGSRVFDSATGLPLENVEVSLIDAATDAVVFTRRTGADGSYRFTSVPTRELLLRIDGSGIGYEDGYAGCEAVWLGSLNLKSVEPVLRDSCAQMPGFTNDFGLDSTTGPVPTTTVPALPSTTTTTPPTTTPPTTTTTPPPTTAPPTTAPPTTTTTVPADTTGPMISTASASPAQIWEQHPNLCSGQPKQSVISATAADPSGVTEMRATWTVGNFFEDEVMTGGATRTTTMGPYPYLTVAEVWPYTEDVTVTITATDGAGNTSQTTVVVTVTGAADCFG